MLEHASIPCKFGKYSLKNWRSAVSSLNFLHFPWIFPHEFLEKILRIFVWETSPGATRAAPEASTTHHLCMQTEPQKFQVPERR
jgi:hypothetical protein